MAIIETQGFTLDNSGQRIVVDPITRIEGHLRIEVNVDKSNVIRNAVSTGTMWRGLEVILKGRDPRDAWAFVERICGVCTGVHALASVRSVAVMSSSRSLLSFSARRSTRNAVMILVVLAFSSSFSGLAPQSSLPLLASQIAHALAETAGGPSSESGSASGSFSRLISSGFAIGASVVTSVPSAFQVSLCTWPVGSSLFAF